MIKKLFRYDFKIIAEKLIPFYIAILVISIISRLITLFLKFDWEDLLNGDISTEFGFAFFLGQFFLVFAFFIVIAGIFLMTNFIMISRYHQSIYSNEGYLINTLPLDSHQIIISKIFNFAIWLFISSIVVIISVIIIVPYDFGNLEITTLIALFPTILSEELIPQLIIFSIISSFVSVIFHVIKIYLSITFANLFTEYKLVMGIVGYIGLSIIISTISSLIILPIIFINKFETQILRNPFTNITDILNLTLSIIFCIVGYYILIYLHKNKLNLE